MPICIYTYINTYIHTYIVACEEFCVDEVNYSLQVKYFCTCEEFCVDEVNYSLQVKYFVPARSSALMRLFETPHASTFCAMSNVPGGGYMHMRRRIHAYEEEDTCQHLLRYVERPWRRIHAYEEEDTCI
jgi:uncharacterized membrane protein YwzB